MSTSLRRTSFGACVLAAALLMSSGGAVAMAEPTGDGTGTSGDTKTATTSQDTKPTSTTRRDGPISRLQQSLNNAISGLNTAVGSTAQQLTQPIAGLADTATKSTLTSISQGVASTQQVTRTVVGVLDNRPTPPAATTPVDPAAPVDPAVAPGTTAPAATTAPGAPAVTTLAANSNPTPPPAPTYTAPINPIAPLVNQLGTGVTAVTVNTLGAVQTLAQAGVGVVATALPLVVQTVPDVLITLLTSTSAAILPLVSVPTDLGTLLGVAGTTPTTGGSAPMPFAGPAPSTPSAVLRAVADLPQTPGSTGTTPNPAPVDLVDALGQGSATSVHTAVAANAAAPTGVEKFLGSYGGVITAVVVVASLWALAAAALPGLAGMLIPTAAGAHIGYRQAKAHSKIRAPGLARFVRGGPIGVVRSGHMVSTRSERVSAPEPGARPHLRRVA